MTLSSDTCNNEDIVQVLADTFVAAQPATIRQARMKVTPEDFQVNEMMTVDFTESGEHCWLLIEKRNMNTAFVANLLAKWAGIPSRDVGYSGLKDRHAVTQQWFSLRLPKGQLPDTTFHHQSPSEIQSNAPANSTVDEPKNNPHEEARVLAQHWHNKKLNRNTHQANHFVITLREVTGAHDTDTTAMHSQDLQQIENQLTHITQAGVPNYFGLQRFGHEGNNIRQALEWFEKGTIDGRRPHPKKSRDRQSILLSAARSLIFNQILATRVADSSWNTGLDGEVFNLDGTGSVFASESLDDTLKSRLQTGDIHPTAVLWGVGNDKVQGTAKQLENQVVNQSMLLSRLAQGLENKGIKAQRRALRLPVQNLSWQWLDTNRLQLDFQLPSGCFATSVLAALVAELQPTTSTQSITGNLP